MRHHIILLPTLFLLASCEANDAASQVDLNEDFEGDEPGECSDLADNDRDGYFDCQDNDCWGSPECADGVGGGGGGGGGDTDTNTEGDSEPTYCPGDPLCDFTNVQISYRLDLDFLFDTSLTQDCYLSYTGDGTFSEVGADKRLTMFGAWKGIATTCAQDISESTLWWDWTLKEAHHSFFFNSSTNVLESWFAHGEPDEYYEVEEDESPLEERRWYITDINKSFTQENPTINWQLEEDLPEAFLVLRHNLDITFTIED